MRKFSNNQIIVMIGETGSGKSTQSMPLSCITRVVFMVNPILMTEYPNLLHIRIYPI